jgi:hypothetical protein
LIVLFKDTEKQEQDKRVKSLKALSDGLLGLRYLQNPDFKTGQKKDKITK